MVARLERAELLDEVANFNRHVQVVLPIVLQEWSWRPASPAPAMPAARPRQTPPRAGTRCIKSRREAAACWFHREYGRTPPTPRRTHPWPARCTTTRHTECPK